MHRIVAVLIVTVLLASACGGSTGTPPPQPTAPPGAGTTLPLVEPRDFDAPHDPAELACGTERSGAPAEPQQSLSSRHVSGTAELETPETPGSGVVIATFTGVRPDEGFDPKLTVGSLLGPVNLSLVLVVRNMDSVPVREVTLTLRATAEDGTTYESAAVTMSPAVLCPGQIGFARFDPEPLRSAPRDAVLLVERAVTQLTPGFAETSATYPLDLDILSHGRNGDRIDLELRNTNGEQVIDVRMTVICFRNDGVILSASEATVDGPLLRGEVVEASVPLEEPACVNYLVAATGANKPRA